MSLASSPYSRSTARGQKANRGHPRSTIVEKKGTLVAPVEGTTRARTVSVERPRTSACIPGQVTLLLDKRQVSLPLPSGKVPKADSGVESPSPSLWTQWTGDITCTSTIRKSVTGLRGFLPPRGESGQNDSFGATLLRNDSSKGRLRGIRGCLLLSMRSLGSPSSNAVDFFTFLGGGGGRGRVWERLEVCFFLVLIIYIRLLNIFFFELGKCFELDCVRIFKYCNQYFRASFKENSNYFWLS